jgi:hypothetical protein
VKVIAVWIPMLAGDSRGAWQRGTVPGAQFWDGRRIVGQWLAELDLGGLGYAGVVWDAWFLFGPDARWSDRPHGLLGSGSPVINSTGDLERALARL